MKHSVFSRIKQLFHRRKENRIPYKPSDALDPNEVWRFTGKASRWTFAVIHRNRGKFFFALLLNLLCTALALTPAIVIGEIVDQVFENRNFANLSILLSLLVIIPVVRHIMIYTFRHYFEDVSLTAMIDIRHALYRHLQYLDSTYYSDTPTGNIMAKLTNDLDSIRFFLAFGLYSTIENVFIFVLGFIYLIILNIPLTLVTVILTPFILILVARFAKKIKPVWSNYRQAYESLNSVVQENITGNRTTRAFVRQDYEVDRFEKENLNFMEVNRESAEVRAKYIPPLDALAGLLSVPVLIIGGIMVINGTMTLGALVTYNSLLWVLANPTRQIGFRIDEMQRFTTSAEKLIDLLATKSRVTSPETEVKSDRPEQNGTDRKWLRAYDEEESSKLEVAAIKGEVEFKNVNFRYGGLHRGGKVQDTLKNINLHVKPGQTIGIMGSTGSGKTTLIKLISRLADATEGEILIDGQPIKSFNLSALRRNIGVVTQDVFLFSDTVENNIAYGRPEMEDKELYAAADAAQAAEFIPRLDDGYQTIIGERGTGLSGGQRQRLSLARALAVSPSILVLDDTTSAVDMETDKAIRDALADVASDRTVFMIASRIASVRDADLIIIMDNGEIIERGTHDELIDMKGAYYDIFLTQMGQIDTALEDMRKAGETIG